MYPDEFLDVVRNVDFWASAHPLVLEFAFWVAVIGVSAVLWAFEPQFVEQMERAWNRLARRRWLSVALIGVTALVLRASLLPLVPIPESNVHDEYSYILGAKTFVAGRLTNPAHPMWMHFEGFHVNVVPTYQSMYPPAQAGFLALGLLLFHQPWWGVWLSVALMCAAVTWMLQGWVPPGWALLGGAFCVLRFTIFSYWMNSYWGGAVAAIGGALVLGAVPRIRRKPALGYSLALALGLAILANSRPFEGFVVALVPMLCMTVWFLRQGPMRREIRHRVVLPAVALLGICAAGMLYYNWRGTGNALEMPYTVNQRQYHISQPFLWQTRYRVPDYHHPIMRRFYVHQEFPSHLMAQHSWGLAELSETRFRTYYDFFVWPLLLLFIPGAWIMVKSPRVRILALSASLLLAGLLLEAWPPQPHYASPATCVVIAILLYGLRLLRTWRPRRMPLGLMMSRAIVLLLLAWLAFPIARTLVNPLSLPPQGQGMAWQFERARLQALLERTPGKHVVIVHSPANYIGGQDWIYNDPDVDLAKVVWARDMGEDKNQELVSYFRSRHIWFIDQTDGFMQLQAYKATAGETLAARRTTTSQGQTN